jgi:uncharacterized membrane protein YeaQ/YmgE (transglycosylase-associated protein family)
VHSHPNVQHAGDGAIFFPSKLKQAYPSPVLQFIPENPVNQTMEEEPMLHLLWTALIGIVVGVIAKFIMPGKDPGGIFITMILGIAGSFLGTYLGRFVGHYQQGQSAGFLMSLLGAIIILGIYHLIRRTQSA